MKKEGWKELEDMIISKRLDKANEEEEKEFSIGNDRIWGNISLEKMDTFGTCMKDELCRVR